MNIFLFLYLKLKIAYACIQQLLDFKQTAALSEPGQAGNIQTALTDIVCVRAASGPIAQCRKLCCRSTLDFWKVRLSDVGLKQLFSFSSL